MSLFRKCARPLTVPTVLSAMALGGCADIPQLTGGYVMPPASGPATIHKLAVTKDEPTYVDCSSGYRGLTQGRVRFMETDVVTRRPVAVDAIVSQTGRPNGESARMTISFSQTLLGPGDRWSLYVSANDEFSFTSQGARGSTSTNDPRDPYAQQAQTVAYTAIGVFRATCDRPQHMNFYSGNFILTP